MLKKIDLEIVVGLFVIAGLACLAYLAIRLGGLEVFGGGHYELKARFAETGGLKTGSNVVIAGVQVGRVKSIALDDYRALVVLAISNGTQIQEDAIASVRTRGLIGEKFIEISPGGSDTILKPGDPIRETQPAVDLETLISKYIFTANPGEKEK